MLSREQATQIADEIISDADRVRLQRRYARRPLLYPLYRSEELVRLEPWQRNMAIHEALGAVQRMPAFRIVLALWIGVMVLSSLESPEGGNAPGGGTFLLGAILVFFVRVHLVREQARTIARTRLASGAPARD